MNHEQVRVNAEHDEAAQEHQLGSAVRSLREAQRLSVRTLAKASGFSPSFISQVENGLASPSISSMERIANALGVSLSQFFSLQSSQLGEAHVVRAGEGRELTSEWSHAAVKSLGSGWIGRIMSPVLLNLAPGGRSGPAPVALQTEEFAMVLSGHAHLRLEVETQELGPGDVIHLTPGSKRAWENRSSEQAQILVVSAGARTEAHGIEPEDKGVMTSIPPD